MVEITVICDKEEEAIRLDLQNQVFNFLKEELNLRKKQADSLIMNNLTEFVNENKAASKRQIINYKNKSDAYKEMITFVSEIQLKINKTN